MSATDHFSQDTTGLPQSRATEIVDVPPGGSYELRIAPVTKRIGNAEVRMLAYNGHSQSDQHRRCPRRRPSRLTQPRTSIEMTHETAHLTGRCMCGTVRFEVRAPLLGAAYCHCKRCQRRTGSPFSASALTQPGSFAITHGSEAVRTYRPGDGGWNKSYCSECGSHVLTRHPKHDQLLGVRLGTLDQDPGVRPSAHQFVDYAAEWAPMPDDGLPRFAERMRW